MRVVGSADREFGSEDAPQPVIAGSLDDIADTLRQLRAWAGNPSYAEIASRVARDRLAREIPRSAALVGRTTVYDCFKSGRSRVDAALVVDIVAALGVGAEYLDTWRQALRAALQPAAGLAVAEVLDGPREPPSTFRGRDAELASLLAAGSDVLVIEGMPGIGKSALADAAAQHLVATGAVDRVLRVDLRGHLDDEGVLVDDVLDGCLRILRPGEPAPDHAVRKRAAYRDAMGSSRILLVLDNAGTADQVRDLLPHSGTSRVIVTTRRHLDPLPGAEVLALHELARADAESLVLELSGRSAEAAGTAVTELCATAGRLPLALSLLASQLVERPEWSLAEHLSARLARSDRLELDDAVQSSIQLSYDHLSGQQQTALRTLMGYPGETLTLEAAAALTAQSSDECADTLAGLERFYLLQSAGPQRWRAHDLIRTFGQRRGLEDDRPSDRVAAGQRLLDHYLDRATVAVLAIDGSLRDHWYWPVADDVGPRSAALDAKDAREWLATERSNLLAAAGWAAANREPGRAARLAATLSGYLWERGELGTTLALHRIAVAIALHQQDPRVEALAERDLGFTLARASRMSEAGPHLEHALTLYRRIGDPRGEESVLNTLSIVASASGDQALAIRRLTEVIAIIGNEPSERLAIVKSNLAVAYARSGDIAGAADLLEETARAAQLGGWTAREQWARNNVAELLVALGRPTEAVANAQRAIELAAAVGDDLGVAYATSNLSVARHGAGQPLADVLALAGDALAAARELNAWDLVASVLNNLGDIEAASGRADSAREHYRAALEQASAIDEATEVARAQAGLAQVFA